MVFPLYDDNPFKRASLPYATWSLIGINLCIFLTLVGSTEQQQASIVTTFGAVPQIVSGALVHGMLKPEATLVTSMFLHAGWGHIVGNMVYLWVFGDDIEDALGSLRFVAFYLLAGIAAALAFVALDPHSTVPLIGASGAVSGVLAAYLMLRPCAKVSVFVLRIVVRVQAYWVIGAWAALQLFSLAGKPDDGVAYMAHVGGFAAGALLFFALRPPGTRLFECVNAPEPGAPAAFDRNTLT